MKPHPNYGKTNLENIKTYLEAKKELLKSQALSNTESDSDEDTQISGKMVCFQKASSLLSKKLSENIINQSLAALNKNVFSSLDDPSNDNLIDLSLLFQNSLQKQKLMTKEYLDSFMHVALTWDPRFTSSNLVVHDLSDPRIVTCKQSMETFKSTFSSEAMEPGDRYFF